MMKPEPSNPSSSSKSGGNQWSSNPPPPSKGGNNQWPIHDASASLNYASYPSNFPGTSSQGAPRPSVAGQGAIMANSAATATGAPTLSSSSQGYGQHDPSSHYGSYQQQSQPYQYYPDQQQQQQPYSYYLSGGSSSMTSTPSYTSPTHVHTSLPSSPVSGSQGLGPIGALLSPKADLAGQDSHNHISNQPYQYHAAGTDTKDISRPNSASTKKPRSLSSPIANFSSFTSNAPTTSIHSIASATATNPRGGTTAIAANMSPPSSISSASAASPPSSVSSPTSPKKKGSQTPKKSPALPMGLENAPPKSPKPAQSYSFLITTAILESLNKQLTLNEIYEWVMEHYPWYRNANNGWKNSIRHNLSLNKAFMRVPRPPSEPGKGSYWKLDPNHQPNVDGGHGGAAGTGGATRTSKTSRRSSSARSLGRRSTSDPQSPPTPTGQPGTHGIPDIPLAPVPILSKRNEPDPYLFKMHPASSIMTASSTIPSSANRRHSHLLSHDHDYTSQQQSMSFQQHADHQQSQYAHMSSSFSLASLNTQQQQQQQQQQQHHGAFFSPTSATGPGSGGDFGSSSFYSNGAPPSLNDTNMMDSSSDSSSFSRFSNQGIYLPQGGASTGISSISRPLSMGSHGTQGQFPSPYGVGGGGAGGSGPSGHSGAYGANPSHSYGGMSQQSGGAGAPLHTNSTGYGIPPFNRGGGSTGGSGPASYGPSSAYRASVDYTGPSAGYSSTSPPTSNSFAMSQGFVSSASGMMSPLSPGSSASGSIPASSTGTNPSGSVRLPSNSTTAPQESRNPNAAGGGGGGGSAW